MVYLALVTDVSVPHIIEVCSVSFSLSLHHNDTQNLLSSACFVKQALCHRFDIYSTFIFTVGTTQEHPNDWDFPSLVHCNSVGAIL